MTEIETTESTSALERACDALRQSLVEADQEYVDAVGRMEAAQKEMAQAQEDARDLQGALDYLVQGPVHVQGVLEEVPAMDLGTLLALGDVLEDKTIVIDTTSAGWSQ